MSDTTPGFVRLIAKILDILERLLPNIFLAWVLLEKNKQKNLEGQIELEKIKTKEVENNAQKENKPTRRILSDFFSKCLSRK